MKSLNELINKLNPEAKMQEIRNTVSDLKEKETELNQKLEDINASKQEFDKLNLGPKEKAIFDKDLKEKINQQRQEQLDLAWGLSNTKPEPSMPMTKSTVVPSRNATLAGSIKTFTPLCSTVTSP